VSETKIHVMTTLSLTPAVAPRTEKIIVFRLSQPLEIMLESYAD